MSDPVRLKIDSGIATITIDRPEKANALNAAASLGFARAASRISDDPAVRVVMIRATGKVFCAGGDVNEFVANLPSLPEFIDCLLLQLNAAILTLANLPVPVISVVSGPVGGGGIGIALCADIVLASESMKLRGGYSAIGLTPDVGGCWFLSRRAGTAVAKRIFFLNQALSAHECLAAGIVDEVHPDEALGLRADQIARQLLTAAPQSLARTKRLIEEAPARSLADQLECERVYMVLCGGGDEAHEGIDAFVTKRRPNFST